MSWSLSSQFTRAFSANGETPWRIASPRTPSLSPFRRRPPFHRVLQAFQATVGPAQKWVRRPGKVLRPLHQSFNGYAWDFGECRSLQQAPSQIVVLKITKPRNRSQRICGFQKGQLKSFVKQWLFGKDSRPLRQLLLELKGHWCPGLRARRRALRPRIPAWCWVRALGAVPTKRNGTSAQTEAGSDAGSDADGVWGGESHHLTPL